MITIEDCIKAFKSDNSKIKVVSCKDYDEFYLFTAYVNDDDVDPFYLVHKETGAVSPYTIAADPNRYYSARELLERS